MFATLGYYAGIIKYFLICVYIFMYILYIYLSDLYQKMLRAE